MTKKYLGFTFVELIVATTILAILATLGFLAYTNQLGTSRDSRRISEVTSITQKLDVIATKSRLPVPTNSVQITTTSVLQTNPASPTLVGYQGEFGSDLLKQIGLESGGIDPKDKLPYLYYVTKDKRFSQLMIYLEDGSNLSFFDIVPKANAGLSDYSTRFPRFFGKPLGMITENTTKRSIHDIASIITAGYFNIVTTGANYSANFSDKVKITGASFSLLAALPNKSCKRLRDIGASNGDGIYKINPQGSAEMEVYCDMTRDGGGWTFVMKNDGNSDSGALLNQRNTGNGYNTTLLFKNNFGETTVTASGSATLSDILISSIYTEQFRIEGNNNGKVYAKFSSWTGSYNAGVLSPKLSGCIYKAGAEYTSSNYLAGARLWGFSLYHATTTVGSGQPIVDLYPGDPIRFGGWSGAGLCPGERLAPDGMRAKVFIR